MTATPPVKRLTAQQKAAVQSALEGSTNHYEGLLGAGKTALGSEKYSDAFAGLTAMADPKSGAARFRDWRSSSNAERDLTFMDAFKVADANYTAENEPAAIGTWRDDMSTLTGDLGTWVTTAVEWQISSKSDAQLAAAEQTIRDDLTKARADITATIAAS